jgi:alcohol dehydrogenase, propanol-preferring
MHRSLIEADLKPGHWVVFPGGGGGVGIQGVQLARYVGPTTECSVLIG